MKRLVLITAAVVSASLPRTSVSTAAPVLQPNDFIIAIDADAPYRNYSNSPGSEGAANAIDGSSATKYLNFGEFDTGIIVTPFTPGTVVQSMVLTTANDRSPRDPSSWAIWGTNDPIDHNAPGVNNGTSIIPGVTWTPIASGSVAMPGSLPGGSQYLPLPAPPNTPNPLNDGRFQDGPTLSFSNSTAYDSYRIVFPTTKDPNGEVADSMQVSEIQLFPTLNGPVGSANILSILDSVSGIQLIQPDSRFYPRERPAFALDGSGPQPLLPSQSGYPEGEAPFAVVDGTLAKYLNFGGDDSGFIVTPTSGASTVKSFRITTANDAVDRDPASYQLFGTNDAITSANNSYGTAENWTLISSGSLALPAARDTLGPVVPVTNSASFTSYKMLFPTRVGPGGLMQIAEASFFPDTLGAGTDILNPGDPILAVDATIRSGLQSKYLNFGEQNSGMIITPTAGSKTVTGLQITTANDAVERDPATYQIFGTNDPITSTENSQGTSENWTLIATGDLNLPAERLTLGPLTSFANVTSYASYKIVFPTVKDEAAANSMQITGIQLFDSAVQSDPDFNGDGDVDGKDLLIWQRGLGLTGQTNNDNGDADGNGIVNAVDLSLWKAGFGSAVAATGAAPEPSSALLATILVGGLGALTGRGTGKGR